MSEIPIKDSNFDCVQQNFGMQTAQLGFVCVFVLKIEQNGNA